MKYKFLKSDFFYVVVFLLEWIVLNYNRNADLLNYSNDYKVFSYLFMHPQQGYNNLIFVGSVITFLFIISVNSKYKDVKIYKIIRINKKNYFKKTFFNLFFDSISFSFTYVLVNTIFCSLCFDTEMLIGAKFYLCSVFYAITFSVYFFIVGLVYLLLNNLFYQKNIGFILCALLFCVLAFLHLHTETVLSPVFYAAFIEEWFVNNHFNLIEYLFNIIKCFFVLSVLYYLNLLIFSKKDILNE